MSIEALSAVLSMDVGDSTRKLVLIGLANHAHKDGTAAWSGVNLLAEYACCSTRTVQRHIAALLEMGHIREGDQSVVDQRIPARYRPIAYEVALTAETAEQWRREHQDGRSGRRVVAAAHGEVGGKRSAQVRRGDNLTPLPDRALDTKDSQVNRGDNLTPLTPRSDSGSGVTPVTVRGDTPDHSGVTPVSPKPSYEPPKEPKDSLSTADAADDEDFTLISQDAVPSQTLTFADFWKVYPLKTGKIAAQKAWDKAVKDGVDPSVIVNAAVTYAGEIPPGVDRKRLKHPQGWISAGRYLDEIPVYPPATVTRLNSQYDDEATWGTVEEREAENARNAQKTPEEIEAEVAEAFQRATLPQPPQRRAAGGW